MKVPVGLVVRVHEFGDYLIFLKDQKMQKKTKKKTKKVFISVLFCAIKGRTFLTKSLQPFTIKSYTEGTT